MAAFGIDLGNFRSMVSVMKNGSIHIVCNDIANCGTPHTRRFFGKGAFGQDLHNTVGNFKYLIGRTFSDSEAQEYEQRFSMADFADVDDQLGVKVKHKGRETRFSGIQVLAMHMKKLKDAAIEDLQDLVSDCVVTVPGWFTEKQRQAVLDAAEIVGLNCLRLMNDLTAAALDYGVSTPFLPKNKPKNVAFVDIGYSSCSVSIVSFVKDKLTVRGTAYNMNCGGRDFDEVIVAKAASEFEAKYNINPYDDRVIMKRIRECAELCKEELSDNPEAHQGVSLIVKGTCFFIRLTRSDYEERISSLLTGIETTLKEAMENSGMKSSDIDAVEILGGCGRIPVVKTTVSRFFNTKISTTLNPDGAIARGAAIQCSMMSPMAKNPNFQVNDICSYPIKLVWEASAEEEQTDVVTFGPNNSTPSTKLITFHRSQPFTIEVVYANPETLPPGIKPSICRLDIDNVKPVNGEPAQVKVKMRLDPNGMISSVSAYTVEEKLVTEEKTNKKGGKEFKKVKKLVKSIELPVSVTKTSISKELISKYISVENSLVVEDMTSTLTEKSNLLMDQYGYDFCNTTFGPFGRYIDDELKEQYFDDTKEVMKYIIRNRGDISERIPAERRESHRHLAESISERFHQAQEILETKNTLRPMIRHEARETINADKNNNHIPNRKNQEIDERSTVSFSDTPKTAHEIPSPPESIDSSSLTESPSYSPLARNIRIRHSLMFPPPESPSTIKTRAWRTGRSPGSVFFDITSYGGQVDEVFRAITAEYPNIVAGKVHRQGPNILAEVNFDETDALSREKACVTGFEYKNIRILATEALHRDAHTVYLHLSDLPFLKSEKLELGLRDSISAYGKILDVGVFRDTSVGLFTGEGYAMLDRHRPEDGQPFKDLTHYIPWPNSDDGFYAKWNDMPAHCAFCHEEGHVRKNCVKWSTKAYLCFICGEKGHGQSRCPQLEPDVKRFGHYSDFNVGKTTDQPLPVPCPIGSS
ncbi:adenyl-nucleotide exchange factor sse1 [Apophysomyces sp. BC1015]|nr:adenyl-nucleotide exchange factor sse1 [Apophysomyces sp. BC1015]